MKRNVIFIKIGIIIIFSLMVGLTTSAAQTIHSEIATGVQGWKQVNINGFGHPSAVTISLETFNGQLYAGTGDFTNGTQIWRTSDGTTWNPVTNLGEGIGEGNPMVLGMIEFDGKLYAGTGWESTPAEIWRASDGTDWTQVMTSTITDPWAVDAFEVFGNNIYAAISDTSDDGGVTIYRSSTGDKGSWSEIVTHGNGDVNNRLIKDFAIFHGHIYAVGENIVDGAFVWQGSVDGNTWTQVNTPGFDNTKQERAQSIAIFNDNLYVGTECGTSICEADYSGIWKSTTGTDWSLVVTDFENANYGDVTSLYVFDGALFAVVAAGPGGNTVWKSMDGNTWLQVNIDGWGDSNNLWSLWDQDIRAFNNQLYIATTNWVDGAEIWMMLHQVYLPITLR